MNSYNKLCKYTGYHVPITGRNNERVHAEGVSIGIGPVVSVTFGKYGQTVPKRLIIVMQHYLEMGHGGSETAMTFNHS